MCSAAAAHTACTRLTLNSPQIQAVFLEVAGNVLPRETVHTHDFQDLLGHGFCARGAMKSHKRQAGVSSCSPVTHNVTECSSTHTLTFHAQHVDRSHKLLVHLHRPRHTRLLAGIGLLVAYLSTAAVTSNTAAILRLHA
jgi:hypothetical protein